MTTTHYDYFVIGAGSGGVRSARIAASHGAKVGIAESRALGGTCVNLGCIPKKIMAYGADYAAHFADALGYGWNVPEGGLSCDWDTLVTQKNKEISRLNGIYQNLLEKHNVEILNGAARFIAPRTLDVGGQTITADHILIAVGGTPRKMSCEGAALMATSDEFFHWPEPPKRAVIVGGGYIAVEFAHILHGIGAHVTLVYRGDLFLQGFDNDIREALAAEMRKQGIDLRFSCDITKVEKNGKKYSLYTTCGDILECDLPIAAIGRVPNIAGLELENARVTLAPNGQIATHPETYETSAPHIYALGDVANAHNLTPVAIQEGHVLADRLFGTQKDRTVNYNNIATAVFSSPPLSTVGLTAEQASDQGFIVSTYKTTFKPLKHRLSGRDEMTVMKLVVDQTTDRVLGLHMMGQDAPEIMQGFAVALTCGATKADFDRTMAMHPTSAEEFVLLRG